MTALYFIGMFFNASLPFTVGLANVWLVLSPTSWFRPVIVQEQVAEANHSMEVSATLYSQVTLAKV